MQEMGRTAYSPYPRLEIGAGSEFNSSATFLTGQLVCLLPVGLFNHVMFNLKKLFLKLECSATMSFSKNTLTESKLLSAINEQQSLFQLQTLYTCMLPSIQC